MIPLFRAGTSALLCATHSLFPTTSYKESCLTASEGQWVRDLWFHQSSSSQPSHASWLELDLASHQREQQLQGLNPTAGLVSVPSTDWRVEHVIVAPSFGFTETRGFIFLLDHHFKVTSWSKIGTGAAAGKDTFQTKGRRKGRRASPASLALFK